MQPGSPAGPNVAEHERPAVTPLVVTMIDYGAGNLASVVKGFKAAGADVRVGTSPDTVPGAEALVIPGVGHFDAVRAIDDDWRGRITEAVTHGVPTLGICLGLQFLFEGSDEASDLPGLGLFPGRCYELSGDVKVPHVGWNTLERTTRAARLFEGVDSGAYAYFTHSFAAPLVDRTVAATTHGGTFTSAVERDSVFGVQFHPEKSGRTGMRLLENFVHLARKAS
jgi:glutamine amidotransferase